MYQCLIIFLPLVDCYVVVVVVVVNVVYFVCLGASTHACVRVPASSVMTEYYLLVSSS